MRIIVPRLLPLALAVAAFLALACSGVQPTVQPTDVPAPSRAIQSEAGETPETAPTAIVPTATVEAAERAAPTRRQAEAVAVNEAAPVASETAPCQLVQGEPGPPGQVPLHVEVLAKGLEIPWGLAILPSGDLLVTERPGRVRLVQDGRVVPEPVLEFGVSMPPPLYGIDLLGSEGGLLGVLLHPEFAANRLFYLFYNIDNEDGVQIGRIERYALSGDGRSAAFDRVILDDLPAGLHPRAAGCGWVPTGCCTWASAPTTPRTPRTPAPWRGSSSEWTWRATSPPTTRTPAATSSPAESATPRATTGSTTNTS